MFCPKGEVYALQLPSAIKHVQLHRTTFAVDAFEGYIINIHGPLGIAAMRTYYGRQHVNISRSSDLVP